jgi:ABC-2 type transport system ATP-binding protein
MSKKLIEARAISKSFGNKLAVDNFSLQVREGEIYGLVGPDGADMG